MSNLQEAGISWLIIGSCTGTKSEMLKLIKRYPDLTLMPFGNKWTAQPRINWVREIVEAADKAGVAVFLKDNLEPSLGDPREHFNLWNHDEPMSPMLRKEMPK